jgi:hypothetical protein
MMHSIIHDDGALQKETAVWEKEAVTELVASFANPSNFLKYEEKTHACAATIPTEHTGKTCCDHAYSRPISVTECHAFF